MKIENKTKYHLEVNYRLGFFLPKEKHLVPLFKICKIREIEIVIEDKK